MKPETLAAKLRDGRADLIGYLGILRVIQGGAVRRHHEGSAAMPSGVDINLPAPGNLCYDAVREILLLLPEGQFIVGPDNPGDGPIEVRNRCVLRVFARNIEAQAAVAISCIDAKGFRPRKRRREETSRETPGYRGLPRVVTLGRHGDVERAGRVYSELVEQGPSCISSAYHNTGVGFEVGHTLTNGARADISGLEHELAAQLALHG